MTDEKNNNIQTTEQLDIASRNTLINSGTPSNEELEIENGFFTVENETRSLPKEVQGDNISSKKEQTIPVADNKEIDNGFFETDENESLSEE